MANPEISGNLLKKLRQQDEGMRNPEDVFDLAVFDEPRAGMESAPFIIEDFSGASDSPEQRLDYEKFKLADAARKFAEETSRLFKEEFLKLLNDYVEARKNKKGRQRILDYLVEKGFTMPSFAIYEAEKAAGVLGDLGLDRPVINSQSLLIVFNLPKPLSHFWWKGGVEADDGLAVVVGPDITEWGLFYRQLMPVV